MKVPLPGLVTDEEPSNKLEGQIEYHLHEDGEDRGDGKEANPGGTRAQTREGVGPRNFGGVIKRVIVTRSNECNNITF